MKITKEMVIELNNELDVKGCSFRYRYNDYLNKDNPCIEIVLPNEDFVDSYFINVTSDFIYWLKRWFKRKGIELSCNNTGSTLWSKNT